MVFSQILLATEKIRLCERIYLYLCVWNFDAVGIPVDSQMTKPVNIKLKRQFRDKIMLNMWRPLGSNLN